MSIATQELRLFGLDLPAAWLQIRQAWRTVLQQPVFLWLGPRPTVLLREAQGAAGLWEPQGGQAMHRKGNAPEGARARFHAIALPEEIVLRKQLTLPPLGVQQLRHAVELQALASSPFPSADLAWGHGPLLAPGRGGHVLVELALVSRQQIAQYLSNQADANSRQPLEVWVRGVQDPASAFVLPGFGEDRRLRAQRRGWGMLGLAAALAVALLGALAVTPTLQLRSRAIQASAQFTQLAERARPLVAKREALIAANAQLQTLSGITSNRLNPLSTLHTLTNVLGDETMLQRLQIEGRNVLIVGQTPDTAAMMQKLSAQPGFKGVRAPSAATRPPGAPKETFQVEFTIDDAAAGAPASPASAPASEAKT